MGDILELIQSRRTTKYFLPKFVSWEKVARVLDAGRHAPSSGNIQNWKFIVVIEAGQKQEIAKACFEQYDIAMAHALIVICAEIDKAERYYGARGERLYSIQNCAAAAQNMLLEAHSLGLGTSWIGAFDEEAIRSNLGIPEEARPQVIIALGYPKETPSKPPKYPLESVVYLHKWRGKMRDAAKYMNDTAVIMARKVGKTKKALRENVSSLVDKTKQKAAGISTKLLKGE
jgi:nitroreductase